MKIFIIFAGYKHFDGYGNEAKIMMPFVESLTTCAISVARCNVYVCSPWSSLHTFHRWCGSSMTFLVLFYLAIFVPVIIIRSVILFA